MGGVRPIYFGRVITRRSFDQTFENFGTPQSGVNLSLPANPLIGRK
jgi:hypothetical protein